MLTAVNPTLIAGMERGQMQALLAEGRVLNLPRPREVLRQGEPADGVYLILKGRIEVSFIDVNGNRVLAHLAGPGEAMGEVEQFSGRTCAATCTTMANTTVLIVDAALLLRHLAPDLLLRNIADIFHDRLTRDNRLQSLAMFYGAEDRIRIHLLSMTSIEAPDVQLSQTELAGFAGCSRQTVNKTLAQLRDAGIVQMGRGAIRVLDRVRLENAHCGNDRIVLDNSIFRIPEDLR
ncbi:Crp/Fnr family transcriptional regulator [Paracoccus nototheniae]|uniref:Crp/Fnr family transcriptional regulator n=1 Tax=Paracoccus nototheniae TaxID=2489002 RepID=UPI0013F41535